MTQYGIIGKPLEHSFSAEYFNQKFKLEEIDADYQLYEIDKIEQVIPLMKQLHGFNVTYPYKQDIIPHLECLDNVAQQIGAVNVVCQGIGYNTDWIGFKESIATHLQKHDTHALLLGTGGVSKAIQYALRQMNITYTLVSRYNTTHTLTYEQLTEQLMAEHTIIINCTPLGMKPDIHSLPPLPYQYLNQQHILYDCVYNPEITAFLKQGLQHGTRILNGLDMLYKQAEAAWQIWKRGEGLGMKV